MVVAQNYLVLVGSGLLGNELEYQLFTLAHFEDTFLLAELETRWNSDLPLGCLLSNVPDHDRLFGDVLHWHLGEVQNVWEVEHGSAPDGPDWHDELFSLGQDHEVVRVIRLGLRRKLNEERDLHTWGHSARHVIDV